MIFKTYSSHHAARTLQSILKYQPWFWYAKILDLCIQFLVIRHFHSLSGIFSIKPLNSSLFLRQLYYPCCLWLTGFVSWVESVNLTLVSFFLDRKVLDIVSSEHFCYRVFNLIGVINNSFLEFIVTVFNTVIHQECETHVHFYNQWWSLLFRSSKFCKLKIMPVIGIWQL